ncbi:MAG TPA: tetratricopeptide repeat protein [Candidatus Binatia bacterium]|nr:tetratricopeptide repeat protein [Candidatus Binatia bacterium]
MSFSRSMVVSLLLGIALHAGAADIKITIPRRSHLTPVQRLNQEGVEEINKHRYEKAESLLYKAYLLDPDDPFTLNNLGYIAELQGQSDRALQFYGLARQQASDAVIYRASARRLEGHTLKEALVIPDLPLQINQENVEAVRLLSQGRGPEADLLLQNVLKQDPNNVFTLNNMGVTKELEGDPQGALRYYDQAAGMASDAAAVVTSARQLRGKPAYEIAAQNARSVRARLAAEQNAPATVAELNIRGVSALNRNDFQSAREAFEKAFALDPNNAFAINNIGYLSEVAGDRETAQFYYEKAQAIGGNLTVGLATRRSAEGSKLMQVASDSDARVETKIGQERNLRRQENEPVLLLRRDNSPVQEPGTPPAITPPQR